MPVVFRDYRELPEAQYCSEPDKKYDSEMAAVCVQLYFEGARGKQNL